MSARKKHFDAEVAESIAAAAPEAVLPPRPPKPAKVPWFDECPHCHSTELLWWPSAPAPGQSGLRRCHRCRQSQLCKGT